MSAAKLRGGDRKARLGLVVLGAFVLVTLAIFSGIPRKMYDTRGETVKVVFANTAVMADDTTVRVRGVPVGRVKKVSLNPGGRSATVELAMREEGMPLYRDARADLKASTLLGGNYTIDIDPGTARAGRLDPLVIRQPRTTTQVELDTVLEPIRANQREGLKTMLRELPRALGDHDAPASALRTLGELSPVVAEGVRAVRGEQPDRDLRALVTNTAATVRALDAPAESLTRLVEGTALTVQTTAAREGDIRATVQRAARVLPAVETTVRRLDHSLDLADPVLTRLRGSAADVAPTVRALRPTLVAADRLLRDATPLLRSLRPAVDSLASAARQGAPLLEELTPSLLRADRRILPDLALRDPVSGRATFEMIGPGISALHSLGTSFDDVGGLVNLALGGGERAIDTGPCKTYFTDPTPAGEAQRVRCEEIGSALEHYFNYNPMPPGGGER